jgi:hypothetical protein
MLVPAKVMHAARLPKRHCALQNYLAVRKIPENAGKSRKMMTLIASHSAMTRPTCAELIFSNAGFDLCNCLILRETSRLFVHFS